MTVSELDALAATLDSGLLHDIADTARDADERCHVLAVRTAQLTALLLVFAGWNVGLHAQNVRQAADTTLLLAAKDAEIALRDGEIADLKRLQQQAIRSGEFYRRQIEAERARADGFARQVTLLDEPVPAQD